MDTISHPRVAAVMVILSIHEGELKVALYKRVRDPFKDILSLPAGLLLEGEALETAASRVLAEKTGITRVYLEQLHTFGDVKRDPVDRTIGVSYFAFVPFLEIKNDRQAAEWTNVRELPELAFDHTKIVNYALSNIREKILFSNIVHSLLPDSFTLTQLQKIYEIILEKTIDKRNFRKKILSMDILQKANGVSSGRQRPAQLYKFINHPENILIN